MNDRENLIDLLLQGQHECGKIFCRDCRYYAMIGKCKENMVADILISNGITVPDTNVGKWIPASDPPEDHNEYLVMIKGANRPTALWYSPNSGTWHECGALISYPVTHWMPLPQPPKEC